MRVQVSHRPPKFGSGTRRQSAGLKSQWTRFNSVPSHQILPVVVRCKKGKKMTDTNYNVLKPENGPPIQAWTKGVPLEAAARQQLLNVAPSPVIHNYSAPMPAAPCCIAASVGSG